MRGVDGNLRINREILAAWSGESDGDDSANDADDDEPPRGTESVTRVG